VRHDPRRTRKLQLKLPLKRFDIFTSSSIAHAEIPLYLKVKLAFIDDRRSRLLRDEMEKEQRAARDLAAATQAAIPSSNPTPPETSMPGSGHVLGLPMINEEILDSD
jgi:hypothetical protein